MADLLSSFISQLYTVYRYRLNSSNSMYTIEWRRQQRYNDWYRCFMYTPASDIQFYRWTEHLDVSTHWVLDTCVYVKWRDGSVWLIQNGFQNDVWERNANVHGVPECWVTSYLLLSLSVVHDHQRMGIAYIEQLMKMLYASPTCERTMVNNFSRDCFFNKLFVHANNWRILIWCLCSAIFWLSRFNCMYDRYCRSHRTRMLNATQRLYIGR